MSTTVPAKTAPTAAEMTFNLVIFAASTVASLAFAYYVVSDPGRLTDAWLWVRQLPLLVQLAMWALLLPWMLALWLWSMPWTLAIRVVLIAGVLLFTEYLVFPWK